MVRVHVQVYIPVHTNCAYGPAKARSRCLASPLSDLRGSPPARSPGGTGRRRSLGRGSEGGPSERGTGGGRPSHEEQGPQMQMLELLG